ncbi:MAG: BMP family ABC transporter substrate-binding protein [Hydrogenoanaerobacterium sp.]
MKRFVSVLLSAILALSVFTGCNSGATSSSQPAADKSAVASESTSASASAPSPENAVKGKIAYVTGTGGLGDKSFNDLGNLGIKRLQETGVTCDIAEPKSISEVEGILRNFSETGDYALIIAMGGAMVDPLKKISVDYPKQNYMVIDGLAGMPTIKSVMISQTDEAFLVGAFAGLMEKDGKLPKAQGKNTIGIVGGNDIPLIRGIVAAYEAGARYANPECKVLSAYVGSWSDPAKGSELTQGMYEQGASIVFQAAGGSGMGVIEAAKKSGYYAIGYDGNQNSLAPDNMIGSGVRGLDAMVEQSAKEALAGTFTGGDLKIGMKDNNQASQIALTETNIKVPAEISAKLDNIKKFLTETDTEIPSEPAAVNDYLAKIGSMK